MACADSNHDEDSHVEPNSEEHQQDAHEMLLCFLGHDSVKRQYQKTVSQHFHI